MNTRSIIRAAAVAILSLGISGAAYAAGPEEPTYYVSWTKNGKTKCCVKKTREKADECAAKFRERKGVSNVQVGEGPCP